MEDKEFDFLGLKTYLPWRIGGKKGFVPDFISKFPKCSHPEFTPNLDPEI
jgi:hypothetical protein